VNAAPPPHDDGIAAWLGRALSWLDDVWRSFRVDEPRDPDDDANDARARALS
jgi:hypothetical protein